MKPGLAVSVVIPCFNQGSFLGESVPSVLAQSLSELEILIVNDGSTDEETIRILQEADWPKTRIIHQKNQGRSAARNTGIDAAAASYIFCLDADDVIGPDFLQAAVRALDFDENIGLVYPKVLQFGSRSCELPLAPYSQGNILHKHCIASTSALFRKADWEAVGGFDVALDYMEDLDFWLSLVELGRDVHPLPEVQFYYRRHSASTTSEIGSNQIRRYMRETEIYAYLIRKHHRLYLQHAEVLGSKLATKPDLPRFHNLKLRKYALFLSVCELAGRLPFLRSLVRGRIKKARGKLSNLCEIVSFYR